MRVRVAVENSTTELNRLANIRDVESCGGEYVPSSTLASGNPMQLSNLVVAWVRGGLFCAARGGKL